MTTNQPETLAQECADYATSLRSTINVVKLEGREPPISFLRAAELFERAAARIAELEALAAGYAAARLEIESLQKAAADRRAMQAAGTHPEPCARHCEAVAFRHEVRRLEWLAQDRLREIESLREQMEAVGAGGVAQQPATWPKDAAEVRQFMDANCQREERANDDGSPSDEDRYVLTAHDFVCAATWWADSPPPAAQALDAADARRFRAFVAAVLSGDKIFKNAGVEADQGRPETLDAVRQAIDAAIAAQQGATP